MVNEQFGFREKLSTDLATYALLNAVLISLDKKNLVGGLFCDLQKAFDCVSHDILSDKLECYGTSGIAIKLMRSYITKRYQRVALKDNVCNKLTSKWEPVKHGVPQGSVLGPLLFLIYIHDLPRILNSVANPILFADDTSVIISNTDSQEFLNNITTVMNDTIKWFQRNLLSMNYDKTHFLQFMTK